MVAGELIIRNPVRSSKGCFARIEIADVSVWEQLLQHDGTAFAFVLKKLDEHGNPPPETQATVIPPRHPTYVDGDQLSVMAFKLSRDPRYWDYARLNIPEAKDVFGEATCSIFFKDTLNVNSRKELDSLDTEEKKHIIRKYMSGFFKTLE
jgi:hypothetical protein